MTTSGIAQCRRRVPPLAALVAASAATFVLGLGGAASKHPPTTQSLAQAVKADNSGNNDGGDGGGDGGSASGSTNGPTFYCVGGTPGQNSGCQNPPSNDNNG